MHHDFKQVEVVTYLLYTSRLIAYKISTIDFSLLILSGSNMPFHSLIKLPNPLNQLIINPHNKIKNKERKIYLASFLKISPLIQLIHWLSLVFIFMGDLVVENHFYLIFFMIIWQSSKRKKSTFINLWVEFIVKYFNYKDKKRGMIPW